MAKPKNPPPTAEQVQCVRDAWAVLLWDKVRIAQETGLSLQQVVGLIGSTLGSHWSRERVKRQKAHDATLTEQGEEATKRQMRAALALAGAHAIGAEKAERAMASASDVEALQHLRKLPPLREVQIVDRTNTGRPVGDVGIAASVAITGPEDWLARLAAAGVPREPFLGDTPEQAPAEPPADGKPTP
jgi:hypothetical protein